MGKKLPALLLLPFLSILSGLGQGAVEFKVQYLPETTYTSRQQNKVVSELSFAMGRNEPLQKQGSSIIIDSSIIVVTTGKKAEEGSFSITRHDIHHSKNEQGQNSIKETIYYGTCFMGKQPVFDSIYRENAKPELMKSMLESMQKTHAEAQMPDTILSIGDQFSFMTRRDQPYMPDSIEFYISSTYQLRKVENGIAFFDVTLAYVNPGINDIQVSGGGKGKVEYDITNHFETSYVMVMDTSIEHRPPSDGMHLLLSGHTNFSQTTEIIR
jgi:hypothetical protein